MKEIDINRDHTICVHGSQELVTMAFDNGISTELLLFGVHEPVVEGLLCHILKEGMVCIDLGANIGYHVILESNLVGRTGRVIAIEATGKAFEYLNRNVMINRLQNVETYQFAAANFDGVVGMAVGTASNLSRVVSVRLTAEQKTDVISKRIDSFIGQKGLVTLDLLKLDVEGYEQEVMLGATQSIETFRPNILVEIHSGLMGTDKTVQLLSHLMKLGYQVMYYVPRNKDYAIVGRWPRDVYSATWSDLLRGSRDGKLMRRSRTFTIYLQHMSKVHAGESLGRRL